MPLNNQELKLIIVGWIAFPFGAASGERIRLLAKGLNELGANVRVLTTRAIAYRQEDIRPGGSMVFQCVPYEPLAGFTGGGERPPGQRLALYLEAIRKLQRRLEDLARTGGVTAVLAYTRSYLLLSSVSRVCRSFRLPLFADCVEWFTPSHYTLGVLNPFCWDNHLGRNLCARRCRGIIAISKYIENRCRQRGVPTLRIPALYDFDTVNSPNPVKANTGFDLMYVGNFKADDGFLETCLGVRAARAKGCPVRLLCVGARDWPKWIHGPAANLIEALKRDDAIRLLGRLPEEQYHSVLRTPDAHVLLRTRSITTQAAFPTRLPQLLATGRPVFTTDVPDVPDYLTDRKDAHVLPAGPHLPSIFAERLAESWRDPNLGVNLGLAGLKQAQQCFDYQRHALRLLEFIKDALLRKK